MADFGKRIKSVTVKMTEEQYARMLRAGDKKWPGAPLTDSSLALAFIMETVDQILRPKKKR